MFLFILLKSKQVFTTPITEAPSIAQTEAVRKETIKPVKKQLPLLREHCFGSA